LHGFRNGHSDHLGEGQNILKTSRVQARRGIAGGFRNFHAAYRSNLGLRIDQGVNDHRSLVAH
jgi:hypothetical protein